MATRRKAGELLRRVSRAAGRPLERFLKIEAASGIVLLVSAAVALIAANSPWAGAYQHFWHMSFEGTFGPWTFKPTLEWLVNDGLMVIFFFVVGMEIRREVHQGELSEWRRAALPAAAAVGGMLVPAALYLAIAGAPETRPGWGVPMATDIAFAVGILALLGKRVPPALRVLLLALAVIDDLGAILVIALFYSSGVQGVGLLAALGGVGGILALKHFQVRPKVAYVLPALVVWGGVYASGIHPTIAGVIVGLLTPVRAEPGEAASPAASLIEALHPWVAYGVMPIFALANAGVALGGADVSEFSSCVVLAVIVGLVVGKPVGVLFTSWLVLRLKVASLPLGITVRHLVVLGVVAGVGFTMSLFVAQLAFVDLRLLAAAKIGVLAASGAAAVLALGLGRILLAPVAVAGAAETADDAEASTEA